MSKVVVILSYFFCIMSFFSAGAQDLNSLIDKVNARNKQVMARVEERRQELDRRYSEYLGKPWVPVKRTEPETSPLDRYDPISPIPFDPHKDIVDDVEYPAFPALRVKNDVAAKDTIRHERFESKENIPERKIEVRCNGMDVLLRFPMNGEVRLEGNSEKHVADVWTQHSRIPYDNMLRDLDRLQEVLSLSDWSMYRLVEEVSRSVYGNPKSPDAVLFSAYVLNRFGYLLCLASSDNGMLYKCMATDMSVFNYPCYQFDNSIYYIFDEDAPSDIQMVDLNINGEKPMRLKISSNEVFYPEYSGKRVYFSERYPEVRVEVKSDKSLMSYYNDYPSFYSDGDPLTAFYYHAMMPLDKEISDKVYPVLKKAVAGKTELDAVNVILNFVQTAFVYEYDKVLWGRERYLYPDEVWYYNQCDCEDRSILLSRLVKDLLGLDVALVYWDGHLSCAVSFSSEVKGASFEVSGKSYISCDPTYIGAGVGAIMPAVKDKKAHVIVL